MTTLRVRRIGLRPRQSWRCLVAAALCCAAGCVGNSAPAPSQTQFGGPASPRLLDLDDNPVDPWKPDDSPIAVFIFTRTDCPIANRYAPEIRRLAGQYEPGSVAFALVYVDPNETPDAIRRHMREYDYPCRGLRDPDHSFVAICGATATPEAAVFDRSGAMVYRGRIDDRYVDLGQPRPEPTCHDLAEAIEATIQGRPVVNPRTKAIGCLIADLHRRPGN